MKVFISWSGSQSHKIAMVLKEWIPSVIQSVIPYVSSEDIDKGARWSTDIQKELEQSAFGLLCVTKDNVDAPWLNFEAGALGKSVDKSRVCPFLFNIKRSEVTGPILQFQSTIYEEEDVLKLIKSINKACNEHGIDEGRLEKSFKVWWATLKEDLDPYFTTPESNESSEKQHPAKETKFGAIEKILEEILELSRSNQRILRNPEELLPLPYLGHIIERTTREMPDRIFEHPAFDDLNESFQMLKATIIKGKECNQDIIPLNDLYPFVMRMDSALDFILEKFRGSGPRRTLKRIRKADEGIVLLKDLLK